MEFVSGTWVDLFIRIGVVIWLALCAYWDTRTGQIPNALTMPALVLGGILAGISGGESFVFYGLVLILVITANFLGVMGGADTKILGALGGLWPLGLMTVIAGTFLWVVGRRIVGRKGNFRAGLPIAMAATTTIVIESLFYLT